MLLLTNYNEFVYESYINEPYKPNAIMNDSLVSNKDAQNKEIIICGMVVILIMK